MERKAKARGGFTGWNRGVAAAVAAAALVSMMMLAGCPTEEDSTGGEGGGVPAELIGKWEGTTGDTYAQGKYIEFTSDKKLLVRATETGNATTYTVTSVSGGTVEIQSAGANTSDGSFKYTLNTAKTEMTVSDRSMNGNSVGYATYTKQASGENPGGSDAVTFGAVTYDVGTGNCTASFTYTGSDTPTAKMLFANDNNKATANPMGWSWNGDTEENMTIANSTASFTGGTTSKSKYSTYANVYVVISVGSSTAVKQHWYQIKPASQP